MRLRYRDNTGRLFAGNPDPESAEFVRQSGPEVVTGDLSARLTELGEAGDQKISNIRWWWPLSSSFFGSSVAADISGFGRDTLPSAGFGYDADADGGYFSGDGLISVQGPVDSLPVDVSQGVEVSLEFRPHPDYMDGTYHHLRLAFGAWSQQISDWPDGARWYEVLWEYVGGWMYTWIDSVLYSAESVHLPQPTWYYPAFAGNRYSASRTGTCRNLRVRKI